MTLRSTCFSSSPHGGRARTRLMAAVDAHQLPAHVAISRHALIKLFVLALIFASVQNAFTGGCDEQSCDVVLDRAQDLVLATAGDVAESAARASLLLSSSTFSCCRRFPAISIRSALVRSPIQICNCFHTADAGACLIPSSRSMPKPRRSSGSISPALHCFFLFCLSHWPQIN